jgi:hypothetical protein
MKSKSIVGETRDLYRGGDSGDEENSVGISAGCRKFGTSLDMRLGWGRGDAESNPQNSYLLSNLGEQEGENESRLSQLICSRQ